MDNKSIPNDKAWEGYKNDLGSIDYYEIVCGKSNKEVQVQGYFKNRGTLIFQELELLPRLVFQYYIIRYAKFLTTPAAENEPDCASMFLDLLKIREERDRGCINDIYTKLSSTLEYIGDSRECFNADIDVFGSFKERAESIQRLCNA